MPAPVGDVAAQGARPVVVQVGGHVAGPHGVVEDEPAGAVAPRVGDRPVHPAVEPDHEERLLPRVLYRAVKAYGDGYRGVQGVRAVPRVRGNALHGGRPRAGAVDDDVALRGKRSGAAGDGQGAVVVVVAARALYVGVVAAPLPVQRVGRIVVQVPRAVAPLHGVFVVGVAAGAAVRRVAGEPVHVPRIEQYPGVRQAVGPPHVVAEAAVARDADADGVAYIVRAVGRDELDRRYGRVADAGRH